MLTQLCQELNNWFVKDKRKDIHCDTFTIKDGKITPSIDIKEDQYFRIVDSLYNDGVHQFNDSDVLLDETFDGGIWLMYVPQEIVALSNEIDAWTKKYEKDLNSPYQSESFGGTYSYSKKSSSDGGDYDWRDHFSHRLNRWRKL